MKWYEAQENSDQIEGKGSMVTFAVFANIEDAVRAVQSRGVMGVGAGEVTEVEVKPLASYKEWEDFKASDTHYRRLAAPGISRIKVYGYRKDLTGKWGYGYVDNRDAPTNDPEFADYLRLKKKFEEDR